MNVTKFKEFEFCFCDLVVMIHKFEFPCVFPCFFASLSLVPFLSIRLQSPTQTRTDFFLLVFCFGPNIINQVSVLFSPSCRIDVTISLNDSKQNQYSSSLVRILCWTKNKSRLLLLSNVVSEIRHKQQIIPHYTFYVTTPW